MSEKPVFKINQKLFKQLNDWQEKMEEKEKVEAEIEANNQDKKLRDSEKEKD
ncbi:hypothetical protein [Hydrocoleum sp. CS-953]|uniref:hypothetical protein n=1 Tax=Microcoleaceae TaxID=1892252 RepID=UPI00143D9D96|nr:hypothetical protein [Hydrocoleum sp. CS-953]